MSQSTSSCSTARGTQSKAELLYQKPLSLPFTFTSSQATGEEDTGGHVDIVAACLEGPPRLIFAEAKLHELCNVPVHLLRTTRGGCGVGDRRGSRGGRRWGFSPSASAGSDFLGRGWRLGVAPHVLGQLSLRQERDGDVQAGKPERVRLRRFKGEGVEKRSQSEGLFFSSFCCFCFVIFFIFSINFL